LFALKIGRQTYHGLTGEPPKVEDFFFENQWVMSSSIHADEFPLKKSPEDFIPKLAEVYRKIRGIPLRRDKTSI
jgi:hypothetical protein